MGNKASAVITFGSENAIRKMKILWKPKKWQKIADVVVKQVSGKTVSANIARFLHCKCKRPFVILFLVLVMMKLKCNQIIYKMAHAKKIYRRLARGEYHSKLSSYLYTNITKSVQGDEILWVNNVGSKYPFSVFNNLPLDIMVYLAEKGLALSIM